MTSAIVTIQASLQPRAVEAPLLMLVIPIAMIGRRWGLRCALAAAAIAVALVGARTAMSVGQIGIVGYLSRATAFVTVTTLAGSLSSSRIEELNTPLALALPLGLPMLGLRICCRGESWRSWP